MMSAHTIDLTTIPSAIFEGFDKIKFDYGENRPLKRAIIAQREAQWTLSEKLFSDWLNETNFKLLNDIDEFLNKSFSLGGGENLFAHYHSDTVHASTVILGLHASDHAKTLDTIEEHVIKTYHAQVFRVESTFSKKANLLESLPIKQGDRLIVMIEQTEITERDLIAYLIYQLNDMLTSEQMKRIVILFFMSGSWKNINQIIPIESANRLGPIKTIVKEPGDVIHSMQERLLNAKEITFKVGPKLMDLLYDNFIERDASIVNLRYLYEYAMYEHYSREISLLNLPLDVLRTIFKKDSDITEAFGKLEYFKRKTGDRKSLSSSVNLTNRQIEYHYFVMSQLEIYLILLRDEVHESFPSSLNDLYRELFDKEHGDLAHSRLFIDRIDKVHKNQVTSLRKRLGECIAARDEISWKGKFQDVLKILIEYEKKLDNNDNDKKIVFELVVKLHEHARSLQNPSKMLLKDALYYDDVEKVRSRTMPATRFDALVGFLDRSCHFGVLYDLIHKCPEEISENDLFGDFSEAVNEMQSEKLPTALLKAIYLDLIDCLIHQGLIKRNLGRSKDGILRRTVWL